LSAVHHVVRWLLLEHRADYLEVALDHGYPLVDFAPFLSVLPA
jgi:hypothetical protein